MTELSCNQESAAIVEVEPFVDLVFAINAEGVYDAVLDDNGEWQTTQGLETALLMSHLGERRADAEEVPTPQARRGWIGNELSEIPGYEIGNKAWLYEQLRLNAENIQADPLDGLALAYERGYDWLIEDGLATRVDVSAMRDNEQRAVIQVDIFRGQELINSTVYNLWEATARGATTT